MISFKFCQMVVTLVLQQGQQQILLSDQQSCELNKVKSQEMGFCGNQEGQQIC